MKIWKIQMIDLYLILYKTLNVKKLSTFVFAIVFLAACQKEVITPNQPATSPLLQNQETSLVIDNSGDTPPNPNAVSSNDPNSTTVTGTASTPDSLGNGGITDPLHKRDQRDNKGVRTNN